MDRGKRFLILFLFLITFWILLPAVLIIASLLLDSALNMGFRLVGIIPVLSWSLLIPSSILLVLAVIQFRLQAGEWPVSALPSRDLAQRGLYGVWRHPIYLFFVLVMVSLGLVLGSGSMLALVIPIFSGAVVIYAGHEEKRLAAAFGSCCRGYIKRTAAIVPKLQILVRCLLLPIVRLVFGVKVTGRESIPLKGPLFVVASHRSFLDPLFAACGVKRYLNYVTTHQMFRGRLSSFLFSRIGCIPRKRYARDAACVRSIYQVIRECGAVVIFPEGERSWTGAMGPLKEEVIRLLLRFPDVPILPLRIQGNYNVWPRWRSRPAAGRVKVEVLPAFTPDRNETAASLSEKLRLLIEPNDPGVFENNSVSTRGIEKILYRCPACMEFVSGFDSGASSFRCRECGTVFHLSGTYSLCFSNGERDVTVSLDQAYRGIRITPADLKSTCSACGKEITLPDEERLIAYLPDVEIVRDELEEALRSKERGSMMLTDRRVIFNTGSVSEVLHSSTASVTTEGSARLQMFCSSSNTLYQLKIDSGSVPLWQDLIVAAVSEATGRMPVRS